MKNHMDLEVWQRGMDLVVDIYEISSDFPKEEIYGLTSQIRRAAVSIPSNIAEGSARHGDKEFMQFLYIALGSAAEVETQLILSCRLNFVNEVDNTLNDIIIIKKMLNGLISHIKHRN